MTERSKALVGGVAGAVIGGIAGYLFFTEHGRSLRRQFEPMLDDLVRELGSFRQTLEKTGQVASQGWDLFSDSSRS